MTQQQSKSNRESELFRKQGNEFYKLRNFDGAITLYGESVHRIDDIPDSERHYFPVPWFDTLYESFIQPDLRALWGAGWDLDAVLQAVDDSEQLASAYGNRSSAFYEISRFAVRPLFPESLRDVERALAVSSCPVTLLAKLLNRKDKCELNLENSKVKEKIDPLNALKSGWKNLERFPDISADVNVNYCKEKGRYLTASRDLEPGSVIIVEEAYASAFLPHQKDYFCHQCYSQLPLDFVPCKSCIDVKFCNFSCRDQAQDTFHKYECGNLEKLNNLGIAHLAIRVILATKPSVIADYIFSRGKQYQESDEKFIDFLIPTIDESEIFGVNFSVDTPDDVFFGRNYRTVYNMVTNRDQISLTDALMYAKKLRRNLKKLKNEE
uniref:MYND-type domain-containing protein n=1 Tax=Romanomermis culicivorax TaxID=13658 RepID=A0A915KRU0_ROMCU